MAHELLLALIAACTAGLYILHIVRRRRYPLPPGPKGLPLIGNIFEAPKNYAWLVYQEWSRKYDSDIIHYKIMGTHYIVLNSEKAVTELMERRSNIYSDKPETTMLHLSGHGRNWGFIKYGHIWRARRKLFHQHFRSTTISSYHPVMRKSVDMLLGLLRDTPEAFSHHIRFISGYNILAIVYGMEIQAQDDPYIDLVEKSVRILSKVEDSRQYLVDSFPSLMLLPSWFPGGGFKREAATWRPIVEEMYMRPYREVKAALENGTPRPCLTTDMLVDLLNSEEQFENTGVLEDVIIDVAGIAYIGGSDTATFTLSTFMLAMLLYPEAQRAAQEELDRVVGKSRLPEIEDRESLPYITALVKEGLRWRPILPLALAHKTTADDEYEGYHIPVGSVVIGNSWALLHDEGQYPEPDTFNPARFLDSEGKLRRDIRDPVEAFGYGRRVCPGRFFVKDFLWLTVANILAAFTIEKPTDENGKVVEPSGEYMSGLFSFPAPFEASFKTR